MIKHYNHNMEPALKPDNLYQEIFNLHPMPMWLLDEHLGRIITANQAALEISGYARSEYSRLAAGELFRHPSGQTLEQLFDTSPQAARQVCELHLRHKNGQRVEVELYCQPFSFQGQNAFLLVAQDSAELKQSEQALRQANAELARSNAMIAALGQVAAQIVTLTDVSAVIETLGRELESIGLSSAISYLSLERNTIRVAYLSLDLELLGKLNGGLLQQLYNTDIPVGAIPAEMINQPLFFTDIIEPVHNLLPAIPAGEIRRIARSLGIAPFTPLICLPLKVSDEFVGNLSIWGPSQRRENLSALSIFANQVAGSIEKARLFEAAQRRAKETEMLFNATTAVTSALELDQVLEQILIQLAKVVPYHSAAIFLIEGQQVRVVAGHGFTENQGPINQRFPADDPLLMQAHRTRKPIVLEDAQQNPDFKNWGKNLEVRGWMGVPLIARGQVIGYLTIDHYEIYAYQQRHAALAQAFANEVAIAIENARLFQEVQHLAITDPLLGIYNRRQFFNLANEEFKRYKRYGTGFSAILFDLDHFKEVNDRFGHQVGDQVLRTVAALCQENLREQDLFGRYGGEEFVILSQQADSQAAVQVAERLRAVFSQNPVQLGERQVQVSASFGVCEITPDTSSIDELIHRADQALLRSKRDGKNTVMVWAPGEGDED